MEQHSKLTSAFLLCNNRYVYSYMEGGGGGRGAKWVWWSHGEWKKKSEVSEVQLCSISGPNCCITPSAQAYPLLPLMLYVSWTDTLPQTSAGALVVSAGGVNEPPETLTPWPTMLFFTRDANKTEDGRAGESMLAGAEYNNNMWMKKNSSETLWHVSFFYWIHTVKSEQLNNLFRINCWVHRKLKCPSFLMQNTKLKWF